MPKGIVTELEFVGICPVELVETCPAPECNLSDKEVEQFVDELESYARMFAPGFRRCEQWA